MTKSAYYFFIFLFCIFFVPQFKAQDNNYFKYNLPSDSSNYKDLIHKLSKKEKTRKKRIDKYLLKNPYEINRVIFDEGSVIELIDIDKNGRPIYFTTNNYGAAQSMSTEQLWSTPYNISGSGMIIGEWDAGAVRISHQEFQGRAIQKDGAVSLSGHGTHVAGTLIAGGVRIGATGMAHQATLWANDWNSDNNEMAQQAADGLLISNHSYGTLTGWDTRYNPPRWYGDTAISMVEDYNFGFYSDETALWDEISYTAPYYLIVKSAGNDRNNSVSSGDEHRVLVNSSWTTSYAVRNNDGPYDCIPPRGNAKNVLTVGAVNDAWSMTDFSSWGPTDDGRIKPDICGIGYQLYSAYSGDDSDYQSLSGTSMASPTVAGSLLLLQQIYNQKTGYFMKSSTLKGLAIQTADDILAAGPDYQSGWGVLNSKRAADVIIDAQNLDDAFIGEFCITDGQTRTFTFTSDGTKPLKATICWTDLPGEESDVTLNPTELRIVHDLDMRITGPGSYYPYILDPANPANIASTGDNFRDNVEQIYISSTTTATYTISVTHKGNLQNSQDFSLIVTGAGPEPVADFSSNITVAYIGQDISFSDNSINPASWNWDFGDGASISGSTQQNPQTFTYITPGYKTITLDINGGGGAKTLSRTDYILVLPTKIPEFREDFESGAGDFVAQSITGNLNIWEHGVPGNVINEAFSGSNVWKTDLDSDIPNNTHTCALYTPQFDLSASGTYYVKFKYRMDVYSDYLPFAVWLEYSTDHGNSWQRLGDDGYEYNWYNLNNHAFAPDGVCWSDDVNNYITASYDLSALQGNNICFRFMAQTTGGQFSFYYNADGFSIDDFEIEYAPYLSLPYSHDFEANDGKFISYQLFASDSYAWEWGAGAASKSYYNTTNNLQVIDGAANWMTSLGNTHGFNTNYALEIPPLSLAGHTGDAFLEFDTRVLCGTDAGMNLQYSIDNGATWSVLGNMQGSDPNAQQDWYNMSTISALNNNTGWYYQNLPPVELHPKYDISFLNGNDVRFRFVFGANSLARDGFQIDNFEINGDFNLREIAYSSDTFFESPANNGSVSNTPQVTITLTGDEFSGNNDDDFISENKATVTNLPSGISAQLIKQSATELLFTLHGTANDHTNSDDISNLTVSFNDLAFVSGVASNITNSTKEDLIINFVDNASNIRFVKVGGAGLQNGLDWANAYAEVQDAVDDIDNIGGGQVWVAEGIYFPTKQWDSADPRAYSFILCDNLAMYGGFPSIGDPDMEDKDWKAYRTILSGDIGTPDTDTDGDGIPDDPGGDSGDNAYHVVYHQDAYSNSSCNEINGFIITAGCSNNINGFHRSQGGGLFINSDYNIKMCEISSNYASYGGGLYSENGVYKLSLVHLLFNKSHVDGGGALFENISFVDINKSVIQGNSSFRAGGISINVGACSIDNSLIANNSSNTSGGLRLNDITKNSILSNLSIANNSSNTFYQLDIPATGNYYEINIQNTIIWDIDNISRNPIHGTNNKINIQYSDIINSGGSDGWNFISFVYRDLGNNLDIDPHFVSPTSFSGAPQNPSQVSELENADYSLSPCSPLINMGNPIDTYPGMGYYFQDIIQQNRVFDGKVDIGCYESQASADISISITDPQANESFGSVFDFGTIPVGQSSEAVFEIENTCASSLQVSTISGNNPPFLFQHGTLPFTLMGDETETFLVEFAPSNSGTFSETIVLNHNAGNSNPYSYTVTGSALTQGLIYSSDTFNESTDNDGNIDNSTPVSISLTGANFFGSIGEDFVSSGKVIVNNLPAGLSAQITMVSAQELEVTLTGNADNHSNADDISNLSFQFTDDAFDGVLASNVENSIKDDIQVDFVESSISVSTHEVYDNDIEIASINNVIYLIQIDAGNFPTTLNGFYILTNGIFQQSDFDKFRLWLSDDSDLTVSAGDIEIGNHPSVSSGEYLNFENLNTNIQYSRNYFLKISADVSLSATVGSNIYLSFEAARLLDPLAHWKLDGNAFDDMGVMHGTISGSVNWVEDRFNNPSKALSVNGSGFINLSNFIQDLTLNQFTYSCWFKISTPIPTGLSCIFNIGGSGGDQVISLTKDYFSWPDGIFVQSYSRFSNVNGLGDGRVVNLDSWYHVTFVRTLDNVTIYINGDIADGPEAVPYLPSYGNEMDVIIGARRNDGSFPFHGSVDDVRVYNWPLSAEEVSLLYNGNNFVSDNFDFSDNNISFYTPFLDGGLQTIVAPPTQISYSSNVFSESAGNDGSIDNSSPVSISLSEADFFGSIGEDFVSSGKVIVSNLPAGLSAKILMLSSQELEITLTGNAVNHSNDDDISNLTFQFTDDAFDGVLAANVDGSFKDDLKIDFIDATLYVASIPVPDNDIEINSVDNVCYVLELDNRDASTTIEDLYLVANGTFQSADITNFKLWKSSNNNASIDAGDVEIQTHSSIESDEDLKFTGINLSLQSNTVQYLKVSATVSDVATSGHNIYIRLIDVPEICSDPNIEACYSFNGNALDQSGNGYHGAVNGATLTADRFGNPDGAYFFDGVDDNIRVGNIANFSDQITISTWISGTGEVVSKWKTADYAHGSWMFHSNDFHIVGASRIDTSYYARSSINPDNSDFYHVVGTFNQADNMIRIYVNGNLTGITPAEPGSIHQSSSDIIIGASIYFVERYFDGIIDDVSILGRALGADEINDLYHATSVASDYPISLQNGEVIINPDDLEGGLQTIVAPPVQISYSNDIFNELSDNTGSIDNSNHVSITLNNANFFGTIGEDFVSSGKVIVNSLPVGLTAQINMVSAQELEVSLTGNADNHSNDDDINNLSFQFTDDAFDGVLAVDVENSYKDNLQIDFIDANIIVSSVDVPDNDIFISSFDNIAYLLRLEIQDANTVLNSLQVQTNGNYLDTDITGFKLWLSQNNNLSIDVGDIEIGNHTSIQTGGNILFDNLNVSLNKDDIVYCKVTADVSNVAVAGNTINVIFDTDDAPEPVGYWPINGNANDVSANSNNGIVYGAVLTNDRFGNPNSAYYFDGVNDYIEVLDNNILDGFTDITITVWFNKYSIAANPDLVSGLVCKNDNGENNRQYKFETTNTNTIHTRVCSNGDASDCEGLFSREIILSEWIHATMVYNSASGLKIYINGNLDQTSDLLISDVTAANDEPLVFGAIYDIGNTRSFFNGLMDDIRIYNVELSANQIYQLYTQNELNNENISFLNGQVQFSTPILDGGLQTIVPVPNEITIQDEVIVEPLTGMADAEFTVTLEKPSALPVSFQWATMSGSALAGQDFTSTGLHTETIASGETVTTISVPVNADDIDEPDEIFYIKLYNGINASINDDVAQCTIIDSDTEPLISINDISVVEGNTGLANEYFTVTLSHQSAFQVEVNYNSVQNTATSDIDYTNVPLSTLIFQPFETIKQIPVSNISDELYEINDETFFMDLSLPINAIILDNQGECTIIEDDAQPQVAIESGTVTEPTGSDIVFKQYIELDHPSIQDISVDYFATDVSAAQPDDYMVLPSTITVPAGELSTFVNISIIGDNIFEGNEDFRFTIQNPVNTTLAQDRATVTIIDDEEPPQIVVSDASVIEGNAGIANAIFTVSLTSASLVPVSFDYATVSGTATADDYQTVSLATLSFAPLETEKFITIEVFGDLIKELDEETFKLQCTNPVNASLLNTEATGTIFDDDDVPQLQFSDISVIEGDVGIAEAEFTFTLSNPTAFSARFCMVSKDLTALSDESTTIFPDYEAVGIDTILVIFNAYETVATASLNIIGDELYEGISEQFEAQFLHPINIIIPDNDAIVTIIDDDDPPLVSVLDAEYDELGNKHSENIGFSISSLSQDSIFFTISSKDNSAIAGKDYESLLTRVKVPPYSSKFLCPFTIIGDDVHEIAEEYFTVHLSNPVNTSFAKEDATITIIDDDDPPVISLEEAIFVETDGDQIVNVTISLSNQSDLPISFDYKTLEGTALAPADFIEVSGGNVTILPEDNPLPQIQLTLSGDDIYELYEEFLIEISNPIGASISQSVYKFQIQDDEPQPELNLIGFWDGVLEGDVGTANALFTVELTQASELTTTVEFDVMYQPELLNSATPSLDYTYQGPQTIVFNALETVAYISVEIIGDEIYELDELVTGVLSKPLNATISGKSSSGRILNDDPIPELSIDDINVLEGNSGVTYAEFTLSLSHQCQLPVEIKYNTTEMSAHIGEDYVWDGAANDLKTIIVEPFQLEKALIIPIKGDLVYDDADTFAINIVSAQYVNILDDKGICVIIDNETKPELSVFDYSITERNSGKPNLKMKTTLPYPCDTDVSFDISTADNTAKYAQDDYIQIINHHIQIPAFTKLAQWNVQIIGDNVYEGADETFFVNYTNGTSNIIIPDIQSEITILEDDVPPTLIVKDIITEEGNSGIHEVYFIVELSHLSAVPITFDAMTEPGTALPIDNDYIELPLTQFSINPYESEIEIPVSIIGDTISEPIDEYFYLFISNPVNSDINVQMNYGTCKIYEDDNNLQIYFITNTSVVSESAESLEVAVVQSRATIFETEVRFSLTGTAKNNRDYIISAQKFIFPSNKGIYRIPVIIKDDNINEPTEELNITITSLSPFGDIGQTNTHTISIINDDPPLLKPDWNDNYPDNDIDITFNNDPLWLQKIYQIFINDKKITSGFDIFNNSIHLNADLFDETGYFDITVKAHDFHDARVKQYIYDPYQYIDTSAIKTELTYGDTIQILPKYTHIGKVIEYSTSDISAVYAGGNKMFILAAGNTNLIIKAPGDDMYKPLYLVLPITVHKKTLRPQIVNAHRIYGSDKNYYEIVYDSLVYKDKPDYIDGKKVRIDLPKRNDAGVYKGVAYIDSIWDKNYDFIVNGPWDVTVRKKRLECRTLYFTRQYGDPNPPFEFYLDGFEYDDDISDIDRLPQVETDIDEKTPTGYHQLVTFPYGGSDNNYFFDYKRGDLRILKRPLKVIVESAQKVYGDENPVIRFSYESFVNGDTEEDLEYPPIAYSEINHKTPVGTYKGALKLSKGSDNNYELICISNDFIVTRASLIVKANNQIKTYGSNNPVLTYEYEGFVNGEHEYHLTKRPVITAGINNKTPVGSYPGAITISGASSPNYSISYQNADFTVAKANLIFSADEKSITYGNDLPVYTWTSSGFVNGESEKNIAPPSIKCSAVPESNAGIYPIVVSGAKADNYNIQYRNASLKILRKQLIISAQNITRKYGENNPELTYTITGFTKGQTKDDIELPVVSCPADSLSPVGQYAIRLSGGSSNNYEFVLKNGVLQVTKQKLVVTADDKEKNFGTNNPAFTVSYAGFVNGDDFNVLKSKPFATSKAVSSSPAGSYTIVAQGGEDANYSFVYVNGALKINAIVPVVITAKQIPTYSTKITLKGFVNSNGGTAIIQNGFYWATHPNPGLADNVITLNGDQNDFQSHVNGLLPNTKYYYRAWAENEVGKSLGNIENVTTFNAYLQINGNTTINENSPVESVILTFNTFTKDDVKSFEYSFVNDGDGSDNDKFVLSGKKLYLLESPDFETYPQYTIHVQSQGDDGSIYDKVIVIHVKDLPEPPKNLSFIANRIKENETGGFYVGVINSEDDDSNDTHIYSLPFEKEDNAFFALRDDSVFTKQSFDFETDSVAHLHIVAADKDGKQTSKTFTIDIIDINEDLLGVTLSDSMIIENMPLYTYIGRFIAQDLDSNDKHTYILYSKQNELYDNNRFRIIGDSLFTAVPLNYEQKNSYTIQILVMDGGTHSIYEDFEIFVKDSNDPPFAPYDMEVQYALVDEFFHFEIPDTLFIDEDAVSTLDIDFEIVMGEELIQGLVIDKNHSFIEGVPSFTGDVLINIYAYDEAGASDTLQVTVKVVDQLPIGVQQVQTKNSFTVYPNPNDGLCSVKFSAGLIHSTMNIYDIAGKLIYDTRVNSTIIDLDLRYLRSGAYTVKVISGKNILTKKLIIY